MSNVRPKAIYKDGYLSQSAGGRGSQSPVAPYQPSDRRPFQFHRVLGVNILSHYLTNVHTNFSVTVKRGSPRPKKNLVPMIKYTKGRRLLSC